jgi:hypothetical protein
MSEEQPTIDQPAVVGEFMGQISFYKQPDGKIAAMPDLEGLAKTDQLRIQTLLSSFVYQISKRFLDEALIAAELEKNLTEAKLETDDGA